VSNIVDDWGCTLITYRYSSDGVTPAQIVGFFEGWLNKPTPESHLRLLESSDEVVLAVDESNGMVVGFITAITDRVLSAYIPFLEVLPAYRGRGIGSELVRRMLSRLKGLYMVDVLCDPHLVPFYEKLGMRSAVGAMLRNHHLQSGYRSGEGRG
jgi:ribosomal protein S18 acetylase RimI-like enzyme